MLSAVCGVLSAVLNAEFEVRCGVRSAVRSSKWGPLTTTRRGEFRAAHLDRALLVFRAPHKQAVEDFVRHDPYVTNGLIRTWEVRPSNVVIGNDPAAPGPPPPRRRGADDGSTEHRETEAATERAGS